jgi:ATP-binding cassette subfamily B protein
MTEKKLPISNKKILKFFWQHTWKYPWRVTVILVMTVIGVSMDALYPWAFKGVIDLVSGASAKTVNQEQLTQALLIILAIYVIGWVCWRIVGFVTVYWQPRVISDLQQTSFNRLLDHSYRFFTDNFSGSLVRKVRRVGPAFEQLSDEVQFRYVPVIVILVGTTIGLALRFPLIAAAFLVWCAIFIYTNYLASMWKLKIDIKKVAADSEVTGGKAAKKSSKK